MTHIFETGASTAPANDLVLTVMNDGAVYALRKHAARMILQGMDRAYLFRDMTELAAKCMRAYMGSKFKTRDIGEAARIIQGQTITHILESLVSEWNGSILRCVGRRWYDRVNGNSYFSAAIFIPTDSGEAQINLPFQYGYGSQWEWACLETLKGIGFSFPENVARSSLPLSFEDQGHMLKRDMFAGIYFKGCAV